MTRDQFLSAATKAAEIRLKCNSTFAGLREHADAARTAARAVADLERRIAEIKSGPSAHGNTASRAFASNEISMVQRDLAEQANLLAVAQRLTTSVQEQAQRYAKQRDSTAEQVAVWRRELDATERPPTPHAMDQFSPVGGAR